MSFPPKGIRISFLSFTVGFFYEPLGRPHRGAIAASPAQKKKKGKLQLRDKCSGEMGMVEIDWAILKERLCQKKARDSRGRVDMGHFLSREVSVELDRQCWTDLNSISGLKNLGQGNTRVPEGSQGSTENNCSW